MSDPAGTLYDETNRYTVPFLCKPIHRWVDGETRALMTKLCQQVRQPFYKILARGATDSRVKGQSLIEQPKPRIIGGDIYEFDLIFSSVPVRPSDFVEYVMNYQFINTGGTSGPTLAEIPVKTNATISWRYIFTTRPETIKLRKAFRLVETDGIINGGGEVPPAGAKTILAEDEKLSRWKPDGNIWEVKTITVPSFLTTPV